MTFKRGAAAWLMLSLWGCGPVEDPGAAAANTPLPIGDQACAACGMLVRDQTAPRAQVVHRDGARVYTCSLGDLLVYLSAPSRHGAPGSLFVEAMDPEEDPRKPHVKGHEWLPAEAATYVVGIPRTGVMGPPVLAYRSVADAQQVASRHPDARILDFAELRRWWEEQQGARR